jgi:hypothetical protein
MDTRLDVYLGAKSEVRPGPGPNPRTLESVPQPGWVRKPVRFRGR